MALKASVHFGFCLGAVHVAGGLILLRQGGHVLHALKAGGVLGVDAQLVAHQLAVVVEAQVFPLYVGGVGVEVVHGRADDGAEAAVHIGLGVGLIVVVHVEAGGYAGREVFQNAQAGELVYGLRREPGLVGKDLVVQPVLQRQVVGVGAEKDHGGVGVGVLEAGDEQIALQIYLPLKDGHILLCRAHIDYGASIHPDLVAAELHAAAEAEGLPVVKSYHRCPPKGVRAWRTSRRGPAVRSRRPGGRVPQSRISAPGRSSV